MTITLTYNDDLSRVQIEWAGAVDLVNPGFESGTSGWVAVGGALAQSSAQAHSGTFSGQLTPDGATATVEVGAAAAQAPAVGPGTQYTYEVWVYSPDGYGPLAPAIRWLDAGGGTVEVSTGSPIFVVAATWARLELTATAPPGAVSASPRVWMQDTPSASDTLHVDDASLAIAHVQVQRSTNGLFWQSVRGGVAVPVVDGQIALDDYEFAADVANTYRVVDTGDNVFDADAITPNLAGRVWLKSVRHPFLNRWVYVFDWSDIGRAARHGVNEVQNRSQPVTTSDLRASRTFEVEIATRDFADSSFDPVQEARDLDLILASGDVFFVHVPAASQVPGGYVVIGDTTQHRAVRSGTSTELFTLPCRITTAPDARIVAGTMTYGALLNLYGGYTNVLAANPSYAALLDLMASPDDLVVL